MTQKNLSYFSICSGIECASVAWHPLGFKPLGFCEIEPFRSAVLNYHYPEVKNYGDFTKITKEDIGGKSPDILVGGPPCATFSIAGLREGLESDRGNLALEFILLIKRLNPTWVIWENVCGVLSSNGGKDFGSFLGGLAELRYGFAYRVLDTQFVRTQRFPRAIPQMRRRVFVVGHIRDWRRSAEVLFDKKVLSWHSPPLRRKQSETARTFIKSIKNDSKLTDNIICFEQRSPDNGSPRIQTEERSPTLTAMTGGNRQPCIVKFKNKYPEDTNGLMHCGDELDTVSVRKFEVDILGLQSVLKKHRQPIKKISETLDVNKTTVEHWFRTDKSFSIPSPDIWFKLKNYLGITTDEFDQSIMEFEEKDNVFESSQRVYDSNGSYPTITASNVLPKVFETTEVVLRKLTPIECERLQGLPDNYTQIPYRGKSKEECPTSKRYEACGRGMSVNVMEFLGTKIKEVNSKYEK